MAGLVVTYGDLPLGTTDAAVVAIAERLRLTDVATLDRRHFTVVRPSRVDAFTLLPWPSVSIPYASQWFHSESRPRAEFY